MLTWEDGKPRSRGGPFDILYTPRTAYKPTPEEQARKREQQLLSAKKKADRDNHNCGFCIALPNQADADKQKRIKKADV